MAASNPSPAGEPLRLYGQVSDRTPLAWSWVEEQLRAAPTYWVVARSAGHPHPRPVWGLWHEGAVVLSVGSQVLVHALAADPVVTVHLESGTDVVVVEGTAETASTDAAQLAAYDEKYDWVYEADRYGPLTLVRPTTILAWRAAGWAGRDSFEAVGKWRFGQRVP